MRSIGRREVCDTYVEHRIDEEWQLRNDLNNCIEEEDEPTRYHGVTEEEVPQVCKVSMKGLYGRFKSGGVVCYGLMDTGAGINIISRRMLESLRRRNRFKVPDMSDEIPDKILVQVANSGFWTLTSRVEMILDLEGRKLMGSFWISEDLQEDLLIGLPFMEEYYIGIHPRVLLPSQSTEKEGPCLSIMEAGNGVVKTDYLPLYGSNEGLLARSVAMVSRAPIVIEPGTGVQVVLEPQGKYHIPWDSEGEITGTFDPCIRDSGGSAVIKDIACDGQEPYGTHEFG